ncbi:DUF3078 domain-containing protein [bacterium]|nr:DUF3078 domain-containing protein [bacterium]
MLTLRSVNFLHVLVVIGIVCCLLPVSVNVTAAEEAPGEPEQTEDPAPEGWLFNAVLGFNFSCSNYDHWTAGGVNTISQGMLSEFSADYIKGRSELNNVLKIEYGLTKLADDDYKKAMDKLSYDFKYRYSLTEIIKPYLNVTAYAPMADSYEYYKTTETVVADDERYEAADKFRTGRSFDPINLEQGMGVSFQLVSAEKNAFDIFIGFGARELVTSEFYLNEDVAETPEIEYSKVDSYEEIGAEGGFNVIWSCYENMELISKLKTFYAFDEGDNGKNNTLTSWNNTLTLKVNKYVSVNASADMIYDTNVLEQAQWKQIVLINLSFQLLGQD